MDFYMNPATLKWKGKTTWVADIELFNMLIASWMKKEGWSKKQAYDEYFEMTP